MREEERKKRKRRREEGEKKKRREKTRYDDTNPTASACVSLLSAQSNNGPSKLGQSDVPVTGDRRVGGQQGSSPSILV